MAPIMSPKILNEILMHGTAAEVDSERPLTLPAVPRARPSLALNAGEAVISSAAAHRMVYSRARYTSLPNSKFVFHAAKPARDAGNNVLDASSAMASPQGLVSAPMSSMDCDLADERNTLHEHVLKNKKDAELPAPSSSDCSESAGLTISTISSARSSVTNSQPSTAATSIPPWDCMYTVADPVAKFGMPQTTVPRYTRTRPPPADSIRITRKRRASEAAERSTGLFISRTRKNSDARGLRGLGMRTLQVLKKVMW